MPPRDGAWLAPPDGSRRASALFRVARFARPRAGMIVLGFLLTLAGTAVGLIPPYFTMRLLDGVLVPHQNGQPANFGLVPWYLGGLLGAALLAWLLDSARLFVLAWTSERVSADLRTHTYGHMLRLSVDFFGGKRTGDLMSRVSSDTERLCNYLSMNLVDFASDVLMIIMTAAVLLAIDPVLALAALCPFPLILWLVARVRGRLLRGYRGAAVVWAAMTSVLADTVPGIRVVKAFAQETRESERFDSVNERVVDANNRLNRIWALFGPTVTLLTTSGLLIVWAFACWRVFGGLVTVGVLTAFLAYITRFYARAESMIRMVSATQRAAASAQRIFEVLDRVPSVPEPTKPVHPGRLEGAIELRGVRFKYGAREVLHGIDLIVRPGEMIGLVGPSGAGKSTLINLVCRFYDVAEGAILVDGTDVRSFPGRGISGQHRHRAAGALPVLWHGGGQHRLRPAQGYPAADRRGRPCRPCPRIHPAPARRLRLDCRRARPGAFRRRTPAHLHRPRPADRSAHPDPRRGHVVGGYRDRTARSRRRCRT